MKAWVRAWMIASLALTAGACGHWAASRCGAERGYVDASSADGVTGDTPFQVSARCVREGGTHCEAAKFISRNAAECVARAARLPAGLRPWRTDLVYNARHRTVIWAVETLTSARADRLDGRVLLIHATSGRILERSAWGAVS